MLFYEYAFPHKCFNIVDGQWKAWGQWQYTSGCSVSCGSGVKSKVRHRQCTPPKFGGRPCVGINFQNAKENCVLADCPGISVTILKFKCA